MEKTKKLQVKILAVCTIFSVILSIAICIIGYRKFSNTTVERYKAYVDTLLLLGVDSFNGDDIEKCIKEDKESETYKKALDNISLLKENSEISFMYAIYFDDTCNYESMKYVASAVTKQDLADFKEDAYTPIGTECSVDDFGEYMMSNFLDGYVNDNKSDDVRYLVFDNENFGYQMTGFVPIRNSDNKIVCLLCTDISMDMIKSNMKNYIYTVLVGTVILLVVFLTILFMVLGSSVTKPVREIALSARNFVEQTTSVKSPSELEFNKVHIKSNDEIRVLSDSLVHMTDEIKKYMINIQEIVAEKERISAELDVIAQIQSDVQPHKFPVFIERTDLDIYAKAQYAVEEGADFYDFFLVDNNNICLVIGNASGKGITTTMMMIMAKIYIKNFAMLGYEPDRVFVETNNQLTTSNNEITVKAFFAKINLITGKMTYSSADHENPFWKHSGEELKELDSSKGLSLGSMANVPYKQQIVDLMQGDILYLYTVGLVNSFDERGNEFTKEAFKDYLNNSLSTKFELSDVVEDFMEEINNYIKETPQNEDASFMTFRYKG